MLLRIGSIINPPNNKNPVIMANTGRGEGIKELRKAVKLANARRYKARKLKLIKMVWRIGPPYK
jgi:hypothetical protein